MLDVLLVDDDAFLRGSLGELVAAAGHRVVTAEGGQQALALIGGCDVMVTDLRMPGMDGLALVRAARQRRGDLEVLVMTGEGTISSAVEAMRLGARGYLAKPFEPEELILHLRDVAELKHLREQARSGGRGRLVGGGAAMRRVYQDIDLAAQSDAPVLITGETGTGKELVAEAIHQASTRRERPWVAVNCGALPRELIESELFGHEAGAFTGAGAKRRGRFALAGDGTLFLDEVDSLPLDLQPKLLRVLETREYWPLGAEKPEQSRARVVAAANRSLPQQVASGQFRQDLFYRLNVLPLAIPPLRERPEDIPLIVRSRLDAVSGETWAITPTALSRLVAGSWPGNVRELVNAVERARARAGADPRNRERRERKIDVQHLDSDQVSLPLLPFRQARAAAADEWAERTIRLALETTQGNASQAARILHMSRTALLRLVAKYGIR